MILKRRYWNGGTKLPTWWLFSAPVTETNLRKSTNRSKNAVILPDLRTGTGTSISELPGQWYLPCGPFRLIQPVKETELGPDHATIGRGKSRVLILDQVPKSFWDLYNALAAGILGNHTVVLMDLGSPYYDTENLLREQKTCRWPASFTPIFACEKWHHEAP